MMSKRTVPGLLVGILMLYAAGCDAPAASGTMTMAQARLPIVGGTAETGWPAVGSLVATIPGQGVYPFCSGTLVAPQWVLTAAHCAQGTYDFPLDSYLLQFHIGSDANTPSSGTQVRIDYRVVYPDYDPDDEQIRHDIALVHLETPVTSVTPIATQDTVFRQEWVGQDAFYVGFGVNDPINEAGGGVKRSAWIPIDSFTSEVYYSQYDGQGVCFGDSGGPGLLQVGDEWRVIGVNSAVDSDECNGYGIHTRVDWYHPWVAETMGVELPDCNEDLDMCACPEACGAGGLCDNTLCGQGCAEAYDCLVECGDDEACLSGCYYGASDAGRTALYSLLDCLDRNCSSVSSSAYQQCAESQCGSQIDACFAPQVGQLTCAQVYDCFYGCAQGDDACVTACYGQGSDTAQGEVTDLSQCLSQYCASETTDDGYMDCLTDNCLDPYYACFPPANCDLVGGDCGAGTACYPAGSGYTECYSSNELRRGAACDPSLSDRLACDDGLICLGAGTSGVCEQFCRDDGPCGDGEACEIPVFQSLDDIGVCQDVACTDADEDGHCADVDCDDGDAAVHPDADERCGNGIDDNCDGQTDEGCDACVDADEDGHCTDVDCDDGDAAVHPDAKERCGNDIDDDCDGQTDEGCEDCLDIDRDGYCADVDCDDGSATIFPGAAEVCGNGIDDNCNGQRDEGCAPCADDDRDGVCAPLDCNDYDAAIRPGIAEVCGNGIDDNCNGRTDEGCEACTDADRDGVCDFMDCDDSDPSVFPDAREVCGNGVDDDCDGRVDEGCGDGGGCAAGGTPADSVVPFVLVILGMVLRRRSVAHGR